MEEGDTVKAGQVIVKIPRVLGKLRDITGGLPRVTELFEARNPSNPAVVSEIDGVVTMGAIKRGNREIIIEAKDGVQKKYLVPLTRQILACLLYTSDAADERSSVDLGGRRIIKKKNTVQS